MQNANALNVSSSIQKLLMEKLNDQISQKELINQKLSPFLLQQVFQKKISPNFEPMIQDADRIATKSLHHKEVEVEPKSLNKDNMNPRNVKIEQDFPSQLNSQANKLRRLPFSSKKQSFTNMNTLRGFDTIDSNQEHSKMEFIDLSRTIENYSTPKLNRKLSKQKNLPIKLNTDKKLYHKVQDELESNLRQKKMQEQEQRAKDLQIQALKIQRYEKLKQKFKIYENNVQAISFNFDGSIINFEDDSNQEQLIEKTEGSLKFESSRQSNARTFQTISAKNTQEFQKNSDSINSNHKNQSQNIGLPFQTIFRINKKDHNSISNYEQRTKTINDSKISNCSYQQSLTEWDLPLNSEIQKESQKINAQVSNELSLENSIRLDQKRPLSVVKVIRDSSYGQKNARKQKQIKQVHEEKEKQFMNNFKRQTSTIPYIEITEGIRYQQEMTIRDDDNDLNSQKVRFATIQKPRSVSQRSINSRESKSVRSNLTFRSYLPLAENSHQKSKLFALNKTISVLSQSGKSFQFFFNRNHRQSQEISRIHNKNKELDEFAFFDNPNPIVIKDLNMTKSNTYRPKTTQTTARIHQRIQQSPKPFFDEKIAPNTQILQMKQKILLKQKQRIMSSHTARIVK